MHNDLKIDSLSINLMESDSRSHSDLKIDSLSYNKPYGI